MRGLLGPRTKSCSLCFRALHNLDPHSVYLHPWITTTPVVKWNLTIRFLLDQSLCFRVIEFCPNSNKLGSVNISSRPATQNRIRFPVVLNLIFVGLGHSWSF